MFTILADSLDLRVWDDVRSIEPKQGLTSSKQNGSTVYFGTAAFLLTSHPGRSEPRVPIKILPVLEKDNVGSLSTKRGGDLSKCKLHVSRFFGGGGGLKNVAYI